MPRPFGGDFELWFDDEAGLRAVSGDAEYLRTVRPDEGRFLDLAACRFLPTAEHVVIPGPDA